MHKPTTRQQHLYIAKISQKTQRYDDMLDSMRRVVQANSNLSIQQRKLLFAAFKNVVTQRRTAWKVLAKIAKKQQDNGNKYMHLLNLYQGKIKGELNRLCREVIEMVDDRLVQKVPGPDMLAFYMKIKGDFYRYITEFTQGQDCQNAKEMAQAVYAKGITLAEKELAPTDPVRLALALNFSVFYHQVKGEKQKAMKMANKSFDEAVQEAFKIDISDQEDTVEVMQLLRQNMNRWRNQEKDEGEK